MLSTVLSEVDDQTLENPQNSHKLSEENISGELLRYSKIESNEISNNFGYKHPGIVIGQKSCEGSNGLVPKYMGWLWNVQSLGVSKLKEGLVRELQTVITFII